MNETEEIIKSIEETELNRTNVIISSGKIYFNAIQCAKFYGYSDPDKAVSKLAAFTWDHKPDDILKRNTTTSEGTQEIIYISEQKLYELLLGSDIFIEDRLLRWFILIVLIGEKEKESFKEYEEILNEDK